MNEIISVRYTRNLLLRAICIVYLSAFLSWYIQAPGLYGDNGILPARSVLENSKHKTLSAKIHYQPTLLWLAPYVGFSTSDAIDILALFGMLLAFTGTVSQKFCIVPVFTALWSLYFSLYQVGQTFVSNNFDELLLEAGFIVIFLAPLLPGRRKTKVPSTELIGIWLCRFLLFRVLFTSGLGKLLSGCPKWWTLSALNHYFETMPLPNPLSFYAQNLPTWILRLSTVYANLCELVVPFLFFLPVRSARITAFHLEILLQTCIVATGNFGFSNILIVTLLLSLLDDQFFYERKKPMSKWDILDNTVNVGIWALVTFGLIKLYGLNYNGGILETQISFTKTQLSLLVESALPWVALFLLITLGITILLCLRQILYNNNYTGSITIGLLVTGVYTMFAVLIFFGGSTTLLSMHPKTNSSVHPFQQVTFNRLHKARIVNQYNLFPKITGVEGRPEILLEGSDSLEGPWKEYNFLYKPGNVNHSLAFVAPYSPRLDWQFYWAAQSTYDKQPWLLSLTHRLLTSRPEALSLIDQRHSPFSSKPPKYIRGVLYKYKFSSWGHRSQPGWWVRERVTEYFPPYSKDSPALEDYLRARNLLPSRKQEVEPDLWKKAMDKMRLGGSQLEGSILFWTLLAAALTIIIAFSRI
ncbi:lipase maturation factor 2-like [Euwallacea similis]|uniref:lipase maturation factor 2-like n=1 Tax=Euwallacea similis TaxID=1736056 RepID=UPI00344BAD65